MRTSAIWKKRGEVKKIDVSRHNYINRDSTKAASDGSNCRKWRGIQRRTKGNRGYSQTGDKSVERGTALGGLGDTSRRKTKTHTV